MNTYITIQGDTWDGISFKLFGTDKHMPDLIQANPDHNSTVIFSADIRLTIPTIEVATSFTLPPWKRES
ncbi:tail protein X [Brevibacillus centrosporus]|uniref:tail protein X n=1 Tax=Brevibacillus centrosporus TaxID=54910 RepID=UPI000F09C48E|nr:tail protein X [Brevibacillus centrosporus]MEC2131632.1 tail protein X [Brevibacillus centrosporus]RNB63304.1 phage tail protein [Brevibacillus centrosporus]GED35042.1 membrane protein [Brevibacillus centrosporus]